MSLQPVEVSSFSPVREAVFTRLRQAILSGELPPGTRLVERELAAQLGVSRTPVREAFRKLEHEGLLGQLGRRNLVVRELSAGEVREILAIRAALEGLAAELAATHARPQHLRRFASLLAEMEEAVARGDTASLAQLNERFNATLYAAAGSGRLSDMLGSLREQAGKFAQRGYGVPGRAAEAVQEHRRIVEAIRAHDPERASREAREHVHRSESNLLAGLGAAPAAEAQAERHEEKGSARTPAARRQKPQAQAGDGKGRSAVRKSTARLQPQPQAERDEDGSPVDTTTAR